MDMCRTTVAILFVAMLTLPTDRCSAEPVTDPAPPAYRPKPTQTSPTLPRVTSRCRRYRAPNPLAKDAVVSDWPRFLGPRGTGVSPETCLSPRFEQPAAGKPDPLLVWSLEKGESYSAPSVQGTRVVYFHRLETRELVECLDAESGCQYWYAGYPTTYRDRFNYLNGPRATPAIDGERVYTLGAQGVFQCLDLETGHVYWRRKLAEEFALDQGFFGFATSPLVEGEYVVLNLGLGKCVAAFHKRTGRLVWLSGDRWGRSYATPVAATVHGKRVLFVFAGGMTDPPVGGLLCLDPGSGGIHFRFPWRSERRFSANASSPVVSGNRVFISSTYDVHGAMLEVLPDLTVRLVYRTRAFSSHWTTPILYRGYLYGFANNKLTCMDWGTGKRLWQQTLKIETVRPVAPAPRGSGHGGEQYREPPGENGFGFGSLILAHDRFLAQGETGLVAWLDLMPTGCRVLSWRRLFNSGQTWTAPVLSHGLLYVTQNLPDGDIGPRLLCYDLRATE